MQVNAQEDTFLYEETEPDQVADTDPENSSDDDSEIILQKGSESTNNNATKQSEVLEDGEIERNELLTNEVNQEQVQKVQHETVRQVTSVENHGNKQPMVTVNNVNACKQIVTEAVTRIEKMFVERGLLSTGRKEKTKDRQGTKGKLAKDDQQSEITIYHNAVQPAQGKRISSSSEEMDTSDDVENDLDKTDKHSLIEQFIVDQRRASGGRSDDRVNQRDNRRTYAEPSTSRDETYALHKPDEADELSEKSIRNAEARKATIFRPTGNFEPILNSTSTHVDDDYMMLTAHIDEAMQLKIQKGEFVDLARLVPKDKVLIEDDQRMQLVMQEGKSYWVPVNESSSINSYNKWEQAFRVYTDIYLRANPNRASELIRYTHVIYSISMHYAWDNVYIYDKDFRLHMARNPSRNWGVILQQAWSLRLRDILRQGYATPTKAGHNNDICRRFNRGRCTYGLRCKYEHRCSYCFKMGHAIINCRKMQAERGDRGDRDKHDKHDKHRDQRGHRGSQGDNQNWNATKLNNAK